MNTMLVAEATGIFADVGTLITNAITWMQSFLSEITSDSSKILVTFVVALPLVGLGISLLQRLLSTRA